MATRTKEQHLSPLVTNVAVTLPSGYNIAVQIEHGNDASSIPYGFQFGNIGFETDDATSWFSEEDLDTLVDVFAELKARRARG